LTAGKPRQARLSSLLCNKKARPEIRRGLFTLWLQAGCDRLAISA
jgi:hypothetical protein